MLICPWRRHAATRAANDELLAQEEGFDLVAQGIRRKIHGRRQCLDSGRSAVEDIDEGFEVTAVLLVQSLLVHFRHLQSSLRNANIDGAVAFAGGIAARPP